MAESPKEYADRVLAHCMKSTEPVQLDDVNLKPLVKAAESVKAEPDPLDALLKAYEQPAIKTESKPQAKTLDELMKDYGAL